MVSWDIQGCANVTGYTPYALSLPRLATFSTFERRGWYIGAVNQTLADGRLSANHNALLSKYPIVELGEFVWGANNSQTCIRAVVQISHNILLRVYVCHFRIFKSGPKSRLKQLKAVCLDANNHPGPVIIAGDLNTGVPAPGLNRTIVRLWHRVPAHELVLPDGFLQTDERLPFARLAATYGFSEAFDVACPTWSPLKSSAAELFQLKLDWFFVKGLSVSSARMHPYVSDHRALDVTLR